MIKPKTKNRLPKHHDGQTRRTVSLSFSCALDVEGWLNRLAVEHGMNRSEYIANMVREELSTRGLDLRPLKPMKIRRKVGIPQ